MSEWSIHTHSLLKGLRRVLCLLLMFGSHVVIALAQECQTWSSGGVWDLDIARHG
jgi:hypothetical protein